MNADTGAGELVAQQVTSDIVTDAPPTLPLTTGRGGSPCNVSVPADLDPRVVHCYYCTSQINNLRCGRCTGHSEFQLSTAARDLPAIYEIKDRARVKQRTKREQERAAEPLGAMEE